MILDEDFLRDCFSMAFLWQMVFDYYQRKQFLLTHTADEWDLLVTCIEDNIHDGGDGEERWIDYDGVLSDYRKAEGGGQP